MRYLPPAILATLAALSLAGCERQKAAPAAAPAPTTTPASSAPADAGQGGVLAAAEPFEVLTESAFSSAPADLDKAIAAAVAAADLVQPTLPQDARTEMKTRLDALAAARKADDRAGVALASIEVYRLLVSHAPSAAVPAEVNLLDYAGFRYDADLKAKPVRWGDMSAAAAFGQARWKTIEARITDKPLHDEMAAALADMAAAAAGRNPTLAADSVKRELDLVDRLETFFAKPPA